MKMICNLLLLLTLPLIAQGQRYVPAARGSKVEFRVGYHKDGDEVVKGTFSNIKGDITFDPKQPAKASFDITVSAASVNTGLPERDKELKQGGAFFATQLFPVIRIKSTSVAADGASGIIYVLHGMLTIRDVTKPVKIQFTAIPSGTGYLFRGSFHINRLTWGLGQKGDIDDDVALYIEVMGVKR